MSEEQIRQLINECNAFLADKVGFAPEYSIKIKKGEILRTSSSKIKRRSMAKYFEQGQYNKSIVKLNKESHNMDYLLVLKKIWSEVFKNKPHSYRR